MHDKELRHFSNYEIKKRPNQIGVFGISKSDFFFFLEFSGNFKISKKLESQNPKISKSKSKIKSDFLFSGILRRNTPYTQSIVSYGSILYLNLRGNPVVI